MFHELIFGLLGFVSQVISTILQNDLLSYVFYLGILGFIVTVIRFIYSLNNSDVGLMRSSDLELSSSDRDVFSFSVRPNYNQKRLTGPRSRRRHWR